MFKKWRMDCEAALGKVGKIGVAVRAFTGGGVIFWGRLSENSGLIGLFSKIIYKLLARRRGIEVHFSERISGGLVFAHAYCITVNSRATLGEKVMLFKGATIGSVRSGARKGVPVLGNRVVVGVNATIVGGVHIGDDVHIAPNTFVNFDVPSHSLVVGNPGSIHPRYNATIDYFPL